MYEQTANQQQANYESSRIPGQRRRLAPLVPNPSYENWRIGRGWMWYTMMGGMLAVVVTIGFGGLLSDQLAQPLYSAGMEIQPNLLTAAIMMGMIAGGILGIAQAFYLEPYLPKTALIWWTAATGLAGIINGLLFVTETRSSLFTPVTVLGFAPWVTITFTGAGMGTIVGIVQWLVLRPYLRSSGWWVLACAGAGAAAAIAGIGMLLFVIFGYLFVIIPFCGYLPLYIITGAVVFLPPGAITGIVLARLLRKNELLF